MVRPWMFGGLLFAASSSSKSPVSCPRTSRPAVLPRQSQFLKILPENEKRRRSVKAVFPVDEVFRRRGLAKAVEGLVLGDAGAPGDEPRDFGCGADFGPRLADMVRVEFHAKRPERSLVHFAISYLFRPYPFRPDSRLFTPLPQVQTALHRQFPEVLFEVAREGEPRRTWITRNIGSEFGLKKGEEAG